MFVLKVKNGGSFLVHIDSMLRKKNKAERCAVITRPQHERIAAIPTPDGNPYRPDTA